MLRFTLLVVASSLLLTGCGGRAPALTERNAVFIGDSITAGWDVQHSFSANQWVNAGISGQSSAQIAIRFQTDVISRHPDLVHILVGTNDLVPGWELCRALPGGATDLTPPSEESRIYGSDTCSNIKYMVHVAKANRIAVVVGTIPPWGPGQLAMDTDSSPERRDRITQLNGWIRRYCRENNIAVADYYRVLVSSDGLTYVPEFTADGIHPSLQGLRMMTDTAKGPLTRALR